MQGPPCQTPGARPHQEAPGRCSEGQAGRLPPSRPQRDASYTSYIDCHPHTLLHDPHFELAPYRWAGRTAVAVAEETLSTVAPEGTPKLAQISLATSQVRVGGACYSFPWGSWGSSSLHC